MDALLELCEEAIIKNRLNLATASELLSFSIRYHAKKLHKAVTELIETYVSASLSPTQKLSKHTLHFFPKQPDPFVVI